MARVLILNGAVVDDDAPPASDWLASAPRGAYTTARTVAAGRRVFGLSDHAARLAQSAALLGAPAPPAAAGVAGGSLRAALVAGMATALRAAREVCGGERGGGDWRLTCLVTWPPLAPPPPPVAPAAAQAPFSLFVHAAPLPPRPLPPVAVLVAGEPRSLPGAKDSAWAMAGRAGLEAMRKAAGVEEVVLATADGCALIEGLSSNFAVLEMPAAVSGAGGGGEGSNNNRSNSALLLPTLVAPGAASGALTGTVRASLVTAALAAGLAVEDRPMRVADAERWVGAFLTSTSRGALAVGEVRWPPPPPQPTSSGGPPPHPPPPHAPVILAPSDLVARLDEAVREAMEAAGEEVEV